MLHTYKMKLSFAWIIIPETVVGNKHCTVFFPASCGLIAVPIAITYFGSTGRIHVCAFMQQICGAYPYTIISYKNRGTGHQVKNDRIIQSPNTMDMNLENTVNMNSLVLFSTQLKMYIHVLILSLSLNDNQDSECIKLSSISLCACENFYYLILKTTV